MSMWSFKCSVVRWGGVCVCVFVCKFSRKKRYKGVRFKVISITRGWLGACLISRKKPHLDSPYLYTDYQQIWQQYLICMHVPITKGHLGHQRRLQGPMKYTTKVTRQASYVGSFNSSSCTRFINTSQLVSRPQLWIKPHGTTHTIQCTDRHVYFLDFQQTWVEVAYCG